MSRGRLIFPMLGEFHRLDLAATAADPDGAGPLTSGVHPVYREPRKLPTSDRLGSTARREMPAILVPVQVEPESFERLQMMATGDAKAGVFSVVAHFRDLESMGLVDVATGVALIRPRDRLGAIYRTDGALVQTFPNPPGLFVTEARPVGWGLGGERNLLQIRCDSRMPGPPG